MEETGNAFGLWLAGLHGGIRDVDKRMLLDVFGSAEGLFYASDRDLQDSNVLSDEKRSFLLRSRNEKTIQKNWTRFLESGMHLVTLEESRYPKRLLDIYDAPCGLFYIGEDPAAISDCVPVVAIVGARTCTGYGRNMGEEIGAALAESGAVVISGMARGIDQSGHRGCLSKGGKTIAVLGSGADVCYPPQSVDLYRQIAKNGSILSEQLPGSAPLKQNFPARNRIISGMADAVLVLEARRKSGSLITSDFAMEQGKDVFALPGRVGDPMSEGTNDLLAQGAHVIRSVSGLIEDLFELTLHQTVRFSGDKAALPMLDDQTEKVYRLLDFYPKNLDEIMGESEESMLEVLRCLMRLCELGLARECFNNQYIRTR